MTQFTFSNHGILISKKITTYFDAKITSKDICFLCEEWIQSKTTDFTPVRLYERVNCFPFNPILVVKKYIYIYYKNIAYHCSYCKILGKHHVADVRHKSFQSTPGDIINRSYYAEQFSFDPLRSITEWIIWQQSYRIYVMLLFRSLQ